MTIDVLLVNPDGTEALGESGVFGGKVSGIARIGQRAAMSLIADTNLIDKVKQSKSPFDLRCVFTSSAEDALNIIAKEDKKANYTDEDKIKAIWLIDLQYTEDSIILSIRVDSFAGANDSDYLIVSYDFKPSDAA